MNSEPKVVYLYTAAGRFRKRMTDPELLKTYSPDDRILAQFNNNPGEDVTLIWSHVIGYKVLQ